MSAVHKSRLGKRSPMGALVCAADGLAEPGHLGTEAGDGAGSPMIGPGCRVKLYPGPRVYVNCCGQECAGVAKQHNHADGEVSVFLPQQGHHAVGSFEEVWTTSAGPPQTSPLPRPVSSNVSMPNGYSSPESVDMDEIMAAMVLTSLSCSPVVQSPPQRDPAAASCEMECAGGELSDSGSSGYWSWDRGNGSPAPSPSIPETDSCLAPAVDEGLDMELEQVLFDEPASRKPKSSGRLAYRCLWPSCGKVLTSVVGMKRHIRTLHLGHSSESEQSRREEDFYYTEIHRELDSAAPAMPCASPPNPPADPGSATPPPSLLSQSAPDRCWQVRSEHLYQTSAPLQVTGSPSASCQWTPSVNVLPSPQTAPFRSRSVSVGEQWIQQQQSASLRPHPASRSPPRGHCTSRRVRGEAKKCRKVYGIERRDQWCTACRWKKACQRFVD
ncbi:hypothetical protein MATL_G00206950 [Megalops atlanticus]|uniref:C2H2-type domain-containing protein n=1 Tax=Megalops atlanticus TaxID=7932 RepID=A0A9D3PIK0_MEGAT|nr:hypothetical protein MATL_G00206950 [Megalops atlanticus]